MISRFASGSILAHKYMRGSLEQGVELHVELLQKRVRARACLKSSVYSTPISLRKLRTSSMISAVVLSRSTRSRSSPVQVSAATYERLHAEGVMLRGNSQARIARAVLGIAALEHVGLLDYLAARGPKARCRRWSAPAPRLLRVKMAAPDSCFEVFDGRGKVRLRREQLARGGIDGAVFRRRR